MVRKRDYATMVGTKSLKEVLCDLEVPNTVKISPDAKQVLYATSLDWGHRKGKHAVSTLWVAETGKANSARQITSGLFKDYHPRWSPDGSSIAFISDRKEAGKKWAIYLQNVRHGVMEGEPHPITDVDNERPIPKFEFSPDSSKIAYICADPKTEEEKAREENGWDVDVWGEDLVFNRIRVVDLSTKKIRRVTGSSNPRIAPEKHVMDFAWSPDSVHLAVVSAKSPDIEEPFKTGSLIDILHVQGQLIHAICKVAQFPKNIVWARDWKLYFITGQPSNKSVAGQALYMIAPQAEQHRKEYYFEKRAGYKRVAFGKENDVIDVASFSEGPLSRVECGLADRLYLGTDKVLYECFHDIHAFDAAKVDEKDDIVIAIATSDVNHPIEVFTTTASGTGAIKVSNHGAPLQDQDFGSCKFLSCPSTDKEVQLDGIFLSPSGFASPPSKPLPTIVLIHGGPTDRNTNRFNAYYYYWAPYLLSLGYSILLVNYRGSTGKGQSFAEYSYKGVGKYDWEDVIAMTNHAITEGYADKERLIVGGWSQGGFLSYLCSVRNGLHPFGWKFRAAIPGAGVCDVDTMALTSDLGGTLEPELNGDRAAWNQKRDFAGNRGASALWQFHEAVQHAKKSGEMVIPPMLILHGKEDQRCPIEQARGMRRALESEGLPFECVTYPRQQHLFSEQNFWIDMLDRVARWCETHIGPGEKQK